ncbi:MAG: metallophosphoesterase [Clostridia bacterium]|nr:metallophosphoesterase [Clostridia bacterium]
MTYAISDLHGYPVDKFKALLDKANFSDSDMLYILGDVIDRSGDGGVSLLRYIMAQPNFEFILGNHEDMLLSCSFLFDEVTDESIDALIAENVDAYYDYLYNGGGVTLESLRKLEKDQPGAVGDMLDYLRDAPHIGAVTVGGRDFLLVHSGLGGFSPDKKLKDYTAADLLWTRPELDTEYFDDITTVFGHTPTLYYGDEYAGRVIKTRTWINIDVGCSQGYPPALLRLNDLEVFYGE